MGGRRVNKTWKRIKEKEEAESPEINGKGREIFFLK
jgi:hypothetical protein